MSSTFFGLNISYSGLLASNAALNTTANNIANVQTDGYSKQQVSQQAANAIRTFTTFGCAGAGVETLAIERIRDDFYDQKYWANNTNVGEYNMKSYYMRQLEDYFYDNGSNAGFTSVFNRMMVTGMEALLKNPSNAQLKAQFVGYAGSLTDYFNGLTGNLEALQKDLNSEIKLKVDNINSIASEIATLNKQINTVELGGQNANELRDQRTRLIDDLSQIVDVDLIETPIHDTNNPDRETGGTRCIVKIAGGQLLIDSSEVQTLECVARPNDEKLYQSDIDGLYDIYWGNGQKFNLYNASMGGALKGLVAMRDGNNGEYFRGSISDVKLSTYDDPDEVTGPDGALHNTVTIDVTDKHLMDLNKSNLSDQGGLITLGNQEFHYDSWSLNYDDSTGKYSYKFFLSMDKGEGNVTNDRVGQNATIGAAVNYQGIPYYMNQMNEWVRTFAQKFNDILKKGNDDTGNALFTGNHAIDQDQFLFDNDMRYDWDAETYKKKNGTTDGSYEVSSMDDSYYRLTAKNFAIVEGVQADATLLANKYVATDGAEQNDLLKDLQKLVTDKNELDFRGASASEFLESMLSDVALNAAACNTFQTNFQNIQDTINTKRLSISGVDEDEEAIDLVKFQNAYNLSSKMISVFQEIYDRLILQTGV